VPAAELLKLAKVQAVNGSAKSNGTFGDPDLKFSFHSYGAQFSEGLIDPLGETLHDWREEIAVMWRFTRNNGITEGFHTKVELLQRQAFGLRNFENYPLRVKLMCS
jgi:hypothetical protein